MRKAALIYNPAARTVPKRQRLLNATAGLKPAGWQIDLLATQAAGHAMELARAAAKDGAEVAFACGGDGTINEVVNGLAGSETALGVLRGGMGNVFAKEIGVPRSPENGLKVLLDGGRRRFDLGRANDRYFLLMAGIGLDANVVKRVPPGAKRILGSTSYALHGVMELASYRPKPAELCLDGQPWQGDLYWALLGNTRSYGGIRNIAAHARVDDGLLEAYVFGGHGAAWIAATALKLVSGRHEGAAGVSYTQAKEVLVETPGLLVQADGEYFGQTPMRFSVTPAALDVLLPRGKATRLFSQ